jgi:hypothetical protein
MGHKEKTELLLEQMRLGLLTKDYIQTQIIAKKINIKFLAEEQHQVRLSIRASMLLYLSLL